MMRFQGDASGYFSKTRFTSLTCFCTLPAIGLQIKHPYSMSTALGQSCPNRSPLRRICDFVSEFLSFFSGWPEKTRRFADSGAIWLRSGRDGKRASGASRRHMLGATLRLATWYRFAALRVLRKSYVQITAFISISYLYCYPDDRYGAGFCANRQG